MCVCWLSYQFVGLLPCRIFSQGIAHYNTPDTLPAATVAGATPQQRCGLGEGFQGDGEEQEQLIKNCAI